jgi:phage FluMu gp28-like protein
MTKLFRHVSMIEMESNRKDYTKHGLHLNKAGKEGLARSIANLINQIVFRENKEKQVITLNWKEEVTWIYQYRCHQTSTNIGILKLPT